MLETLRKNGINLPTEYEESITEIQKELAVTYWADGKEIVKDFTYHELSHSKGILYKILKL